MFEDQEVQNDTYSRDEGLGDDTASGQGSNSEPSQEEQMSALRGQLDTVTQQYKSLQGQFKEHNPLQMQAQIAELQRLVLQSQQAKQEQAAPELPKLPANLRNLFGDQADEFERAVIGKSHEQTTAMQRELAAIREQLQEVSRKAMSTPFDVLRAQQSDVFENPEFDAFIKSQKDAFGVSFYDSIVALGARDASKGMSAMQTAARLFKEKTAKPNSQEPPSQTIAPNINSNGVAATPRSPASERKREELMKRYREVISKPNTEDNLKVRLGIIGEAALAKIDLTTDF